MRRQEMERGTRIIALWILIGGLFLAPWTTAKEPYVPFLEALCKKGYGEMALAYLDSIAEDPDSPPELKESLDWERSRCLRIAAAEAEDASLRTSRLAESQRLAEKFFAEHPTHPAAGQALLLEANELLARGEQRLTVARQAKEESVQRRSAEQARTVLAAARDKFGEAVASLKKRLDLLATNQPEGDEAATEALKKKKEALALPWTEARAKRAIAELLMAQSISDTEDERRVKLLNDAGAALHAIFQEYHGSQLSLLAHLWHGKTLEELGQTEDALDNYDEVLGASPIGEDGDIALAPLFGQAQLFRLQLRSKSVQPVEIIREAEQWLKENKNWQSAPIYQSIAVENIRARFRAAELLRAGTERTKALRECVVALNTIAKLPSEYRQEALLLRREVIAKMGTGAGLTAQEVATLAAEAAADRSWSEAVSYYRQALELIGKAKTSDAKTQEAAKSGLAEALYRQAIEEYGARNYDRALTLCGEVVRDNAESRVAEDASAVAIAAALGQYLSAKNDERKSALARLQRVTSYALERYSEKPVADEARLAQVQAALSQDDYQTAEARLGEIGPQSKHYPHALHILGQVRFKQYALAKRTPDAESRVDELTKLRSEAVENLEASRTRQEAAWQSASEPMPPALFDTLLLLAEIHLEEQQWPKAAALCERLLAQIYARQPTSLSRHDQRALVNAVRAWLATENSESAARAARFLVEKSEDEQPLNGTLVELAKLVAQEMRQTGESSEENGLKVVYAQMVEILSSRQALSVPQLVYLGDACLALDRAPQARELYGRVIAAVESDTAAKAAAGNALSGVRARLVRLLRIEGKFKEAEEQVTALLKEHPNALELLMEKGQILQSQANDDSRRWEECLKHWTQLRVRLQSAHPRPPEYFEVVYNAAHCLLRLAELKKDPQKTAQAQQVLKSTLTLSPSLSGAEMVTKYEALLRQASKK